MYKYFFDECIDFTMMSVFFCVSVYSITFRKRLENNASISNFGGGFRCKNIHLTTNISLI
ncbi:Uncharacterized protein FWK35_00021543 [Aphis craccivora]|uniref:Uncharacterized protein n=1 Tax=Aphis craccivora TaxID=307492 RepID=A0A6G0Y0N7_APHCR|nr:Uncharacterized protein FWK35_00021543 [Aphis craccivora]